MPPAQDVTQKLEQLRQRFSQRLIDTREMISDWSDNSHIEELIEESHKLAGTAGTYGFPKLSSDMKTLEQQLIGIKDQDITDDQAAMLYSKAKEILTRSITE